MSKGEATYKAWIDQALSDLGPDVMESPLKISLRTGVQMDGPTFYGRPRALFDAAVKGLVDVDDIDTISIGGEVYARSGEGWSVVRSRPAQPVSWPGPVKEISFPTVQAVLREQAATPTTETDDEYEEVNKPAHYDVTIDGRHFQAVDLIEAMDLDWHTGNALKYIVRAGLKPGVDATTDLRKAAWHLSRRADWLDNQ